MKTQLKADLMLVLVTLCWGVSYYLMDISLTDMGPFTLNAYRFLGAFAAGCFLTFPRLKSVNKEGSMSIVGVEHNLNSNL